MRLLLIEDEEGIASHLVRALQVAGYAVDRAADGEEAQHLGDTEPYDAVILDLGLPRQDGLSVLRAWRAAGRTMPVLILTARDSWREKVEGIDAGADDYLGKPFATEELLARLRALLRRAGGRAEPILRHGRLELDPRTGRIALDGRAISVTAMEYRVLAYLMHHPDRVISQSELVEHIYAQDFDRDSNTIEVMIGRLRRKIGRDRIETLRGLGYRLAAVR
ncbi:MAG: response regulator transcription factor [Geminicoccaceae bacterium]